MFQQPMQTFMKQMKKEKVMTRKRRPKESNGNLRIEKYNHCN